jgi:hypothetical protein
LVKNWFRYLGLLGLWIKLRRKRKNRKIKKKKMGVLILALVVFSASSLAKSQ